MKKNLIERYRKFKNANTWLKDEIDNLQDYIKRKQESENCDFNTAFNQILENFVDELERVKADYQSLIRK